MYYLKNKITEETISLTELEYDRFFDNRDPFEWEEDVFKLEVGVEDDKVIELAEMLDGCLAGEEMTAILRKWAKDNRLVVVHGASDDLIEFDGAWYDEAGAPGKVYLDENGPAPYIDCDCEWSQAAKDAQKLLPFIESKWCDGQVPWTYETEIPHAEFRVLESNYDEDDIENCDIYCIGIVFSLDDFGKILQRV